MGMQMNHIMSPLCIELLLLLLLYYLFIVVVVIIYCCCYYLLLLLLFIVVVVIIYCCSYLMFSLTSITHTHTMDNYSVIYITLYLCYNFLFIANMIMYRNFKY